MFQQENIRLRASENGSEQTHLTLSGASVGSQ